MPKVGTDTAVDVDFSRGAVREGDARAGEADVELQVLGDVVARLEVSRDRGLVVGLGDTAEDVVVHDRAAEGDIPGIEATGGGGALTALTRMSAARAEPDTIASAVANKTSFFMTIPITVKTVQFRGPPGTSGNRLQPNSVT